VAAALGSPEGAGATTGAEDAGGGLTAELATEAAGFELEPALPEDASGLPPPLPPAGEGGELSGAGSSPGSDSPGSPENMPDSSPEPSGKAADTPAEFTAALSPDSMPSGHSSQAHTPNIRAAVSAAAIMFLFMKEPLFFVSIRPDRKLSAESAKPAPLLVFSGVQVGHNLFFGCPAFQSYHIHYPHFRTVDHYTRKMRFSDKNMIPHFFNICIPIFL
jgi:hypothetical protein